MSRSIESKDLNMPFIKRIVFLLIVMAIHFMVTQFSIGQQQAPSWPNWMGKQHDGISKEAGWSSDWPAAGLPTVWKNEIGIGFSSLSIQENRLFTMGHKDGIESVFCLAADSGELIWKHSYPSQLVDNLYEGGPGSTPAIDHANVYTLGKEGQLFCLRVSDGSVIWQHDLQRNLGVALPEWGFNSSAFILDDRVIFESGRVVAFNKQTGVKLWQTDKHTPGYGSAITMMNNGKTLLASLDSDAVRLLDANTGTQLDAYDWKSPYRTNSTTPIVYENTLYISTGYQIGCGLFRVVDGKLSLVYESREMRNHFNNSILFNGYIYGFDGNSNLGRVVHLTCMNHAKGEVAWTHRGLGCGSLMVADGKLLLLSDDGKLVVAEATPDGFRELSSAQILTGRCWTVPVLLNGHVYARNATGTLVCVKLPNS